MQIERRRQIALFFLDPPKSPFVSHKSLVGTTLNVARPRKKTPRLLAQEGLVAVMIIQTWLAGSAEIASNAHNPQGAPVNVPPKEDSIEGQAKVSTEDDAIPGNVLEDPPVGGRSPEDSVPEDAALVVKDAAEEDCRPPEATAPQAKLPFPHSFLLSLFYLISLLFRRDLLCRSCPPSISDAPRTYSVPSCASGTSVPRGSQLLRQPFLKMRMQLGILVRWRASKVFASPFRA